MIPVFGCETARDLLEPFIDGELNTSEQVAIQTHLRMCTTCQARVADMSLIGWSMRSGPQAAVSNADTNDLAVVQSGVLARLKVEREQSLTRQFSEVLSDMRFMWPALGATAAVFLCLVAAGNIWRLTTERRPNSMAALFDTWNLPGTEHNPLLIDNAVSAPRVLHDGLAYYGEPELERSVIVRFVATQDGRATQAELVDADVLQVSGRRSDGRDVLNAVRNLQLAPAQSRGGQPVAVYVVWMFTQTTAVKESVEALNGRPAPRILKPVITPAKDVVAPSGTSSAITAASTTV